jgi:hypothetical protein
MSQVRMQVSSRRLSSLSTEAMTHLRGRVKSLDSVRNTACKTDTSWLQSGRAVSLLYSFGHLRRWIEQNAVFW